MTNQAANNTAINTMPMPEKRVLAQKYEIQKEIARGAFGVVYLAYHTALDRYAAIKSLHAHYSQEPNFRKRFIREAKALAKLNHENIVAIYDILDEDGIYHIVMEYVEGDSLDEKTIKSGHLSVDEAIDITMQIALGLEYAHSFGIVHRDIKPQNILINQSHKVKITDFGIVAAADEANLTQVGQVVGTPRYMSPEQAFGQEVDLRSDIYSLGIVLHQMLSGKTPFDDTAQTAILHELFSKDKPIVVNLPEAVPKALIDLLHVMLEKDKSKRIENCTAVIEALNRIKALRGDETVILPVASKEKRAILDDVETILADAPAFDKTIKVKKEGVEKDPDATVLFQRPEDVQTIVEPSVSKDKKSPVIKIGVVFLLIAVAAGAGVFFMKADPVPNPVSSSAVNNAGKVEAVTKITSEEELNKPTQKEAAMLEKVRKAQADFKKLNASINTIHNEIENIGPIGGVQSQLDQLYTKQKKLIQLQLGSKTKIENKPPEEVVLLINSLLNDGQNLKSKYIVLQQDLEQRYLDKILSISKQIKISKKKLLRAIKKAEKVNSPKLVTRSWASAVAMNKNAKKDEQTGKAAKDNRDFKNAVYNLENANDKYQQAITAFSQVKKKALKQQAALDAKKAKQRAAAKVAAEAVARENRSELTDYEVIRQRLMTIEQLYEDKNITKLSTLIDFKASQKSFLKKLFSKFAVVEVSITSLELTSETVTTTITIDRLIDSKREVTIPGASWKTVNLISHKKNKRWSKFQWQ